MKKIYTFILLFVLMLFLSGCNTNIKKQRFYEVFNNDLVVVINSDGYYQYVNYKEQNPFNETYEYATEFINNCAIVRKNKKDYLINKQGEAISGKYDFIEQIPSVRLDGLPDYSFGLYKAKNKDKYHILNEYGNKLLNLEFDKVSGNIRSNMVYGKIGDEYIVINIEGGEVLRISNVYSVILGDFNTITVKKTKNICDLYDNKGNLLFEDNESIYAISDNIFEIENNNNHYYTNRQGEIILSQYEDIVITNDTIAGKENGLWYLINSDGEKISNEGSELYNYSSSIMIFRQDKKFYLLNQGGYLKHSEQGFDKAIVQLNFVICYENKEETENIVVYDVNGNLVFECEGINNYGYSGYKQDKSAKELYLVFIMNGEKKLYNILQKTIYDIYDDYVLEINSGLIIYRKVVDEKVEHYVANMENEIILAYSKKCPTIRNNQILYSINDKIGVVNSKGENILSCLYKMVPSIYYYPLD